VLQSILLAGCLTLSLTAVASHPSGAQECPPQGDAKSVKVQALDILKNREVAPRPGEMRSDVTFDQIMAPGDDADRWDDQAGATITGVVVGVKVGGIETANCHARSKVQRDTHIEIALSGGAPENQRMIVEVTPRWRTAMAQRGINWSTDALRQKLMGQTVRVTGWMLFDAEHKGQSENTAPGNQSNWRATAWEIHPITAIEIFGQ
jgi:hypothetical protein